MKKYNEKIWKGKGEEGEKKKKEDTYGSVPVR